MVDYTLEIKILDADLDKAIKKLQSAFSVINIQGTGSNSSSSGSTKSAEQQHKEKSVKAWDKMKNILGKIDKKQMALTGMSFGIGAILGTLTDISPLLQSTFKLLTTGIMLMLKPIADFIGLLLRPIMVLFLQYVVIPFYNHILPIFTSFGIDFGEVAAKLLSGDMDSARDLLQKIADKGSDGKGAVWLWENPTWDQAFANLASDMDSFYGTMQAIAEGLTNAGDAIGGLFDSFQTAWGNLVDWFSTNLTVEAIGEAWNNVTGFIMGMASGVNSFVAGAWVTLTGFFIAVGTDASTWVKGEWDKVTKFFASIGSDTTSWVKNAWDKVTKWFSTLGSDVTGWLKSTWDSITGFFTSIANALSNAFNTVKSLLSIVRSSGSSGSSSNIGSNPWGLANGGFINEPIVGLGLNSGHSYLFGEKGAETVTPVGQEGAGGTGRSIMINVTVTNEAQLNTLIARVKQELLYDSRRGSMI